MVSARRPARSPTAFVPERAAGRPTAGPMSRGRLLGAAGEGRRAGRGAGLGLSGRRGARKSGLRRWPSLGKARVPAGDEGVLLAVSESLPAFFDRLWGAVAGYSDPPLRTATASPSKVARPAPGQPRFLSDGVTQESPVPDSVDLVLSSSVDQELGKLLEFFSF